MHTNGNPQSFAHQSLACASPVRNRLLQSSRTTAWSSLLLDCLAGDGDSGVYDKPVTSDVCLSVTIAGEHDLWVFDRGLWRHSLQQSGSLSITRSGESNRLRWRNRLSGGRTRDDAKLQKMISEWTALGRVGQADDIGATIASLLSDDNRWINGQRIEASGGMLL